MINTMAGSMARTTIGMPVFNGERHIETAIRSLCCQTFPHWKLIISDNASTDTTEQICQRMMKEDSRISYYRHPSNLGGIANFRYLLETVDTDYFMWAAADDVWHPRFLEALIPGLDDDSSLGFAFADMANIDRFGQIIRSYPSFARYLSTDRHTQVASFLLEPEVFGRANFFYSVIRVSALKEFVLGFLRLKEAAYPASDNAMVLGMMCRCRPLIASSVLFFKRIDNPTDVMGQPRQIQCNDPDIHGFLDLPSYDEYVAAAEHVCRNTAFEHLTTALHAYKRQIIVSIQKALHAHS